MARVAGVISGARQADSTNAAKDAISETLEDWDSRRDWKYTQVVAPDISLSANSADFDLPTNFKKPYVAYLNTNKIPLFYIERANWHRIFPNYTSASSGGWYTLFNEMSTGKGQLFPIVSGPETLTVLYYRSIITTGAETALLDIPQRWTGYILRGARALLTTGKSAGKKSDDWWALFEKGIQHARVDDLRNPDQFVSFQPPDAMMQPRWSNLNSSWESQVG
jgi:hypothetical protein